MVNLPCSSIRKAWKQSLTTERFMVFDICCASFLTCSISSGRGEEDRGREGGGEREGRERGEGGREGGRGGGREGKERERGRESGERERERERDK